MESGDSAEREVGSTDPFQLASAVARVDRLSTKGTKKDRLEA